MAKLNASFDFTGSLGNLSAYKMKGVDKTIIRTKGGASREKVLTSPGMVNTRRTMKEFGGRSTLAKYVRKALGVQMALGDHYPAGQLIKRLKPIQEMDTTSDWGQRQVLLTANPSLLEGFSLNKKDLFDELVKNPVGYTLSREERKAVTIIPAMIPGINFAVPAKFAMFRFVVALGVVPDIFYKGDRYEPSQPGYKNLFPVETYSGWYPCAGGSPVTTLELQLSQVVPDDSFSLLLSIGISFGGITADTTIAQLPYGGASKVLAVK